MFPVAAVLLVAVTFGATTADPSVISAFDVHDTDEAAEGGGAGHIHTGKSPNGVIQKTVVSSQFRLIFAVGLEGTGHHYFVPALERVLRDNEDLTYINACKVLPPNYVSDVLASSPSVYADALQEAISAMRNVAAEAEQLQAPGTFAVAQQSIFKEGCALMFSYPCDNGEDKVFQYLDVVTLAQAAEAAGVDFRVVYLQRSARGILLSDGSHRHFQK